MDNKVSDEKEIDTQLKILGENIKYLREAQSLSLEALSSITNISIRVLTDMESGADFEARFLILLCDFYDVSISSLFSKSFLHDTNSLFQA